MGGVGGSMVINEYGSAYLFIVSFVLNDCRSWF